MATATPTPTPTTAPTADPTGIPAEVAQFHTDVLHRIDSAVGLFVFVVVIVVVFLGIMTVRAMR